MKFDKERFVKCTENPFMYSEEMRSVRSEISKNRELSTKTLINRVMPQVVEMDSKGLPYETPEEWDSSFYKLGGGQSRRKSKTILARMSWENFMTIISEEKD